MEWNAFFKAFLADDPPITKPAHFPLSRRDPPGRKILAIYPAFEYEVNIKIDIFNFSILITAKSSTSLASGLAACSSPVSDLLRVAAGQGLQVTHRSGSVVQAVDAFFGHTHLLALLPSIRKAHLARTLKIG